METAMKVRRRILVEQHSLRAIAREMGVSRNTIRKFQSCTSASFISSTHN